MTISNLRRKINDSALGEKVNNSIPGILVEGLSRTVSDTADELKFRGKLGLSCLIGMRNPLAGIVLMGLSTVEAIADSCKDIDPETHYSHKSPLYKMRNKEIMERIPVGEALLNKIAQYSPETALRIALATTKPEIQYK